jgi:putative SOS response-associated peptidase YedK
MCYNVNYLTKKRLEYARRLQGLIDKGNLENEFDDILSRTGPVYFVNGFNHPDIPVITNKLPDHIQAFTWGLIPFWVKDPKQAVSISKMTLNARGEDIFSKPSFRNAAKHKRCLVLIDGFFEYHWFKEKSYPYYIKMANDEPMLLAGLWETWNYAKENILRHTFSIITTRANPLMSQIHNKPKASEGPRMPVIVPKGMEKMWLSEIQSSTDRKVIEEIIQPYNENELQAFTVSKLQGKAGVGNVPEAIQKYNYEDLENNG